MSFVTKPTVGRNNYSELIEQNTDALYAVKAAMEALESAAPQVRDYYLRGMLQYDFALREHKDRLERLRSVRDELQSLLEHIEFEGKKGK